MHIPLLEGERDTARIFKDGKNQAVRLSRNLAFEKVREVSDTERRSVHHPDTSETCSNDRGRREALR